MQGGDSPTVDASNIDEESITYADFLSKLESDKISHVTFLAPNGDKAYATVKNEDGTENKPIRIGEGTPWRTQTGGAVQRSWSKMLRRGACRTSLSFRV